MFGIFVVFEALNLKRLRKLPIIDDHKLPENNIQITEERGRILYPIIYLRAAPCVVIGACIVVVSFDK